MHADESRDPTAVDRQILADFLADPEKLREKYLGLLARDAKARKKLHEAEKQAKELRRLQLEVQDLTRRLGSAHGSLDAYRKESARLKADLKRLRGSESYRIGRALTRPLVLMRRTRADRVTPLGLPASPSGSPAPMQTGGEAGAPTSGLTAPSTPSASSAALPPVRLLRDYSFDELLQRFDEEQTPERLGHVLSRAWYQQGMIAFPAELLRAHPAVAEALDPRAAELAERILGADRLFRLGAHLPARGRGPAYRPERGRVMYCSYFTPAFNTNGYSVRTRGVAAGLKQAGTDVVVVGRSGYPWDTKADVNHPPARRHVARVDGVDYVHLPGHKLGSTPVDQYILECADAFVREARLLRPSVIHAASNHQLGLAGLIAARRLGLPFVYEVRGLWEITEASDKPGWEDTERFAQQVSLETLVATEADAVLAITSQTRDELIRRGVDPDRVRVAPNAVDPHDYLPLPKDVAYAASHRVRTDVPVIGFAGSMVPYEGLGLLLDACALLRDSGVDFQVVLAGSGTAEPALKDQVAALSLDAKVRFVGRVPGTQMPRLLSLFDIMPCPRLSLPVTEMVSPLKPLEALSSAKAVVLSDVAPHRDIAGADEQRALLFAAGDAQGLADALRRLIETPDLRRDLGRAGRLWCLDERTWRKLAAGMQAAYGAAREINDAAARRLPERTLGSLRVGLVADEFTTETLSASVQVVPIRRDDWRADVESGLDLIFVESAWKGNGGQWHRGVGHYSPEEHADLAGLLALARERGIPTVFWNKEDPVHFKRFVQTASMCDHVFTTDGNRVVPYLAAGVGRVHTASSLPFYAQPRIHNPLPSSRPFERTVAYAGTYYGERYAKRSKELSRLLETARPFGLAIYDRQAGVPDSPYHFPPAFAGAVRGSLPYDEVIDSYKSHLVNLNVNSVDGSPSMFSRRVVEVAACGGVVLSGPGRGIDETFGSAIPTSADATMWRALIRSWADDPQERLREQWFQMRAVLRAHTVGTALTIVARTAGIPVTAEHLPTYAVWLDTDAPEVVESLAAQAVLPSEVWCSGEQSGLDVLRDRGVRVVHGDESALASSSVDYVGWLGEVIGRTHFEDLLLANDFGPWQRILGRTMTNPEHGMPLAVRTDGFDELDGLVAREVLARAGNLRQALTSRGLDAVQLLVPQLAPSAKVRHRAVPDTRSMAGRTVLVAGHDLKFAGRLIAQLEEAGAEVLIDQWQSHTAHDEQQSAELLKRADTVFCEWGLGNLVWYSERVAPEQRLVVRVHLQELDRPYLARARHSSVDAYIFVGELIKEAAVQSHGVPEVKCTVVSNFVDVDGLDLPKTPDADFTLGLVGIVPQRKRLDLALDVLEGLREHDKRYRLRIKGKTPADYPWMSQRPNEMAYYDEQFARIDAMNAQSPGTVLLDGHGPDMAEWYQSVGVALSVSDFESFHLTIADGAASGALPALLAWDGAEYIYPRHWLSATVDNLVHRIRTTTSDPSAYREVATERFAPDATARELLRTLNRDDVANN